MENRILCFLLLVKTLKAINRVEMHDLQWFLSITNHYQPSSLRSLVKTCCERSCYKSLFKDVLTQRRNSMYRKLNTVFLVTCKNLKAINRVEMYDLQ